MLCCAAGRECRLVLLGGLRRILLGVVGIAAHLVVARRERARIGPSQRLERIVGLALIDHARARGAGARCAAAPLSLECSMTSVRGAIAFRILPVIDVEPRERQLRLIGIGRARVVLDQPVRDLPRLGCGRCVWTAAVMSLNCAEALSARCILVRAGSSDSRTRTPSPDDHRAE